MTDRDPLREALKEDFAMLREEITELREENQRLADTLREIADLPGANRGGIYEIPVNLARAALDRHTKEPTTKEESCS